MNIIAIIIIFMIIIIVYVALISLFSILFQITGLSKTKAFFQTISLLTGVGFTTTESETITSNQVRRRLALACMIIGNVLSILVISLLVDTVASFNIATLQESWYVLLIAFGIFIFILVLFQLPFIKKPIGNLIQKAGYDLYAKKTGGNIITILDNYNDECIAEVLVNVIPDTIKEKTLFESHIKDQYSINVMFVRRKNANIVVNKDTMIQEKDIVVVFGKKASISSFFGNVKLSEDDYKQLAQSLSNTIYVVENYGDKAMTRIEINAVPECLREKTLFESGVKQDYDINIVLVKRDDKLVNVRKDTHVLKGDVVLAFGPFKNIKYIFDTTSKIVE